jgi:Cell division protein ZapA.
MEDKNKLVVKIASHEYTIVSSEESEYMYKIANAVDKEMRIILSANPRISVDMASVLVALNAKDRGNKLADANRALTEKLMLYDDSTEALLEKVNRLEEQIKLLNERLEEKEQEVDELLNS